MSRAARTFGPFFVFAGVMHFIVPKTYETAVPDWLPARRALVYLSGIAEIAGGLGALSPRTRRAASHLNVATLVAVYPANIHMALHPERFPQVPGGRRSLLLRLPLQAVAIAWARAARR